MTAFQPGSPAYEALIAERTELRAAIALLRAESDISDGLIAAAKAEIEHLRSTLGYLADNIDNPALVAIAEAALKPKP